MEELLKQRRYLIERIGSLSYHYEFKDDVIKDYKEQIEKIDKLIEKINK